MSVRFIRIIKRRASFTLDEQSFFETEFVNDQGQPDLSLSVFLIDTDMDLVQTQTEQIAGTGLNPTHRSSIHLEGIVGWLAVLNTPTANQVFNFLFSSHAHRELQFSSDEKLLAMVLQIWKNLDTHRLQDVREKEMKAYALLKIQENNDEWLELQAKSEKVRNWVNK